MSKKWLKSFTISILWSNVCTKRKFTFVKDLKGKTLMEVRLNVDDSYPKKFLDAAFDKLGLKEPHDWYKITSQEFKTRIKEGDEFLEYFDNLLYEALEKAYPEIDWLPWRFPRVPKKYWEKEENQKKFIEYAAKKLGIKTFEDWQVTIDSSIFNIQRYNIEGDAVAKIGGTTLLNIYKDSMRILFYFCFKKTEKMLTSLFPDYNWEPWRFLRVSEGFWKEEKNQRAFLDSLARKRKHKDFTDWYSIKRNEILEHGGRGFLVQFSNSHIKAITSVYHEYNWKIFLFKNLPNGHWSSLDNQRILLEEVAKQLNIKVWEDWYKVKYDDVVKYISLKFHFSSCSTFGASFFVSNKQSFTETIMKVYKEHDWKRWKFNSVKPGYWDQKENQLDFINDLGKKLNFQNMEDWYNLSTNHIVEHGGASLLTEKYYGSLFNLVQSLFPNYKWIPWKFAHVRSGFWDNKENVKEAVRWVEAQLKMKDIQDWQMVTVQLLQNLGLYTLIQKFKGITGLLNTVYPEHKWENMRGSIAIEVTTHLKIRIEELFGKEKVVSNYVHPTLKYPDKDETFVFDFFVPSENIGFDVQAEYHFEGVNFITKKPEDLKEQEWIKNHICRSNGIALVKVPYWWDLTKESLIASIKEMRPNLFSEISGIPIPKDQLRK